MSAIMLQLLDIDPPVYG